MFQTKSEMSNVDFHHFEYSGSYMGAPLIVDIGIIHECSCFIEFIKGVWEKGLPSMLSLFRNQFN